MSAPPRKPKTVSVPRKSGSIILCRQTNQSQQQQSGLTSTTQSSLEVLLLRRSKQLAFGGIHAFPGGNFEENDNTAVNNSKDYEIYVTCCRELFEETGLLIGSEEDRVIVQELVMEEVKKEKFGSNGGLSYFEIMKALKERKSQQQNQSGNTKIDIIEYYAKLMKPFFRIVTIQDMPKRWDTQFYIAMIPSKEQLQQQQQSTSARLFNYAAAKKHNDVQFLDDIDNVLINEESDQFSWEMPSKAIQLHFSNELKLAVPQLLILSMMSSFINFSSIHSYFESINKQQSNQSSLDKFNAFKHDPSRFPILLHFKIVLPGKSQKALLICGDKDYPLEEVLAKEPESQFKEELAEKSKSVMVEINKQQILRVHSDINSYIKLESNIPYLTPFSLMQQQNKQQPQQHPQSPKPSL